MTMTDMGVKSGGNVDEIILTLEAAGYSLATLFSVSIVAINLIRSRGFIAIPPLCRMVCHRRKYIHNLLML